MSWEINSRLRQNTGTRVKMKNMVSLILDLRVRAGERGGRGAWEAARWLELGDEG